VRELEPVSGPEPVLVLVRAPVRELAQVPGLVLGQVLGRVLA